MYQSLDELEGESEIRHSVLPQTTPNVTETEAVASFSSTSEQYDKTNLDNTSNEKPLHQINVHDSLQAEANSETCSTSTHTSQQVTSKLEPKSLMDLLTSKPSSDKPMVDIKVSATYCCIHELQITASQFCYFDSLCLQ